MEVLSSSDDCNGEDHTKSGEVQGLAHTVMAYVENELGSLDHSIRMQVSANESSPASILPSVYYVNEAFSETLDPSPQRPHSCPAFTVKSNHLSTHDDADFVLPSVITLSESPSLSTSNESIPSLSHNNASHRELSETDPGPPRSPPSDPEEDKLPEAVDQALERDDQNETIMNPPEIPTDQSEQSPTINQPDLASEFDNGTPKYVQAMLIYLYMTGQSNYQRNLKNKDDMTTLEWLFSTVHKVIFWVITIMGICYCLLSIKMEILVFVAFRELDDLLSAIFFICCFIVVAYFSHLVVWGDDKITDMLNKWEQYDSFTPGNQAVGRLDNAPKQVIYLGITSQIISILKTVLSTGFLHWSAKSLLLQYSTLIATGFMYHWRPADYINATNDIQVNYGTNLTVPTFLFGSTGMLMQTCFNLRIDAVRDLLIFIAVTNKLQVGELAGNVELQMKLKANRSVNATIEKDVHCWTVYRMLLEVIDITNEVFDSLLNMLHVYNLLLLSVLLVDILDDQIDVMPMIIDAIDLGKAIVMYYVARESAAKGSKCQGWIETLPCETNQFLVANSICSKSAILSEYTRRPLGLGSFLIDTSFLWNFLGLVLSIFGVLVGLRFTTTGTAQNQH